MDGTPLCKKSHGHTHPTLKEVVITGLGIKARRNLRRDKRTIVREDGGVQNSVRVPQKIKNRTLLGFSKATAGYLSAQRK